MKIHKGMAWTGYFVKIKQPTSTTQSQRLDIVMRVERRRRPKKVISYAGLGADLHGFKLSLELMLYTTKY